MSGVTARFAWMILFSRRDGIPSRLAKAACVVPEGFRTSLRSISPGCVGGRFVGRRVNVCSRSVVRISEVLSVDFAAPIVVPCLWSYIWREDSLASPT